MNILGVLLVIFITLKAIGVITWSWWIVLIPLWISIAVGILSFIIGAILMALGTKLDDLDDE